MKVLVTGGCGFLGSYVCEAFRDQGWNVISYDNLTKFEYRRTGYATEAIRDYNLHCLEKRGIPTIIGDILDTKLLTKTAFGCDLIAHCAAQPAMTVAIENPILDAQVNVLGTINALEAARKSGAAFINCSTIHLYGNMRNSMLVEEATRFTFPGGWITENHPTLDGDVSPLHASKMSAETYVNSYVSTYGLRAVNFRLTGIYGPRQFGGEDHGWVANFAIKTVLEQSIKVFGTDKQVRDILYVEDAAQAFVDWFKRGKSGVYNIGGGPKNATSIHELLNMLEELTGKRSPYKLLPERKGDMWWFISAYGSAQGAFGWKPVVRPKTGIRHLVEWIEANRSLFVE
jgi:CDP-paratose 2-epimerase